MASGNRRTRKCCPPLKGYSLVCGKSQQHAGCQPVLKLGWLASQSKQALIKNKKNTVYSNAIQIIKIKEEIGTHLGVFLDSIFYIFWICCVNKTSFNAHTIDHFPKVAVRPSIQIIHRNNVIPGTQHMNNSSGSAQSRGKGKSCFPMA